MLMRDGTKLSGTNGDRENSVFSVQLTTRRIGNHTRLMPSLLKVMTTHTHCGIGLRGYVQFNKYTHTHLYSRDHCYTKVC